MKIKFNNQNIFEIKDLSLNDFATERKILTLLFNSKEDLINMVNYFNNYNKNDQITFILNNKEFNYFFIKFFIDEDNKKIILILE